MRRTPRRASTACASLFPFDLERRRFNLGPPLAARQCRRRAFVTVRATMRAEAPIATTPTTAGVTMHEESITTGPAPVPPRLAALRRGLSVHAGAMVDAGAIGVGLLLTGPDGERLEVVAGVADRATGRALAADHRYQSGSQTKMLVAAAILQLVRDGMLGLDDAVADHLDDIDELTGGASITIAQLLTHTSGIGNYTAFLEGAAAPNDFPWPPPRFSDAELRVLARTHGVQARPGERMEYNNTGYVLLGQIVARATGQSAIAALRSRVLAPLGMTASSFGPVPPDIVARMAAGCYRPSAGPVREPIDTRALIGAGWASTAGDMVTTLDDMQRFMRALITPDSGLGIGLADLTQRSVPVAQPESRLFMQTRWGLGISAMPVLDHTVWGHRGGTFGYKSVSSIDPDSGVGVSIYMTLETAAERTAIINALAVQMMVMHALAMHGAISAIGRQPAPKSPPSPRSGVNPPRAST
ncbi:MAG: beta-lactamase family protein [Alphaproteobacteria bacterium]|nr:beta-lactamase family protein [Alphaproteobacteria bacterium]